MNLRCLIVRTIAGGVLALGIAAALPAHAADVTGSVKKVDLSGKQLVVTESKTGKDVTVFVTEQTAISSAKMKRLTLPRIKTGATVTIKDAVVASTIGVGGELIGTVESVDENSLVLSPEAAGKNITVPISSATKVEGVEGEEFDLSNLVPGSRVVIVQNGGPVAQKISVEYVPRGVLLEFWENFRHNLFKPLLLFFYMGFLVPILRVKFEFPYVIYQGLTIYLLIAIGWHGGEELSDLGASELGSAVGFMGIGFVTNFFIGILAYLLLSLFTKMRRVDKATVAGYYGSDSAGTFVTCLGVLATAGIAYQAYMPVMLAVMEIPGCLVALYLISRLRHQGMDPIGNMPDEPGYNPKAKPPLALGGDHGHGEHGHHTPQEEEEDMALERMEHEEEPAIARKPKGLMSPQLLHEVFLNPGLFLLFGGIIIGYISGLQGEAVTRADDNFFVDLFQGILCLFLLEMGMTASRKLRDLRTAGIGFIILGLAMPNLFATIGILVAHGYSVATGTPFYLGTYALFSVLCAAASYIAVPAVQRLAIPEASPTLPLAASLGLTFTWNVTIGIPIYIEVAKAVMRAWPVT